MRSLSLLIVMLALFGRSAMALAQLPAEAELTPPPEPQMGSSCRYALQPGLEFAFVDLDATLDDGNYVLWRRQPRLIADPLSSRFGGRRGKISGVYLWNEGERWFPAILDDCTQVYVMDTSAGSPEGPLLHLQSVARIYYLRHLEFARSLIGQELMVYGPGLEPRHRLYRADNSVSYPLVDAELLEVLDVETRRYGHTKGLGGFYLQVRNSIGQTGLIKFHHDYLFGSDGTPLWSMLNAAQGLAGEGSMMPPPGAVAQHAR